MGSVSVEFAKALVAVQGQLEGAVKGNSNPAFRSKYADLGACWDACREALQANSIAVLQFPSKADPGHVGMVTTLVFGPTGEVLSGEYQLPLKDPTNAQAAGSAITYARRYALCSVLGICPVDDDGNAASGHGKGSGANDKAKRPTEAQAADVDGSRFRAKFVSIADIDGRKAVYSDLKNASVQEPNKTELLAWMAKEIKAQVSKG